MNNFHRTDSNFHSTLREGEDYDHVSVPVYRDVRSRGQNGTEYHVLSNGKTTKFYEEQAGDTNTIKWWGDGEIDEDLVRRLESDGYELREGLGPSENSYNEGKSAV